MEGLKKKRLRKRGDSELGNHHFQNSRFNFGGDGKG